MLSSENTPILAVDGGGTHCRIALAQGRDVRVVTTGSANVSTSLPQAADSLRAGLAELADAAGIELTRLMDIPAFVGLAGVTGGALLEAVRAALPLRTVRIEDDRPAALRGAVGERDGLIAHCGTGSFLGAQIKGTMRFAGGWGATLGDEASAQWVGRRVLSLTLDRVDGVASGSPLSGALLDRFGGAPGIVAFAGGASPAEFGALAPDVTQAAGQGDLMARQALEEAAAYLERMLVALGWRPGLTICLTGGIGPHFAPYLPTEMQAAISEPSADPLQGALSLAEEFSREVRDGSC